MKVKIGDIWYDANDVYVCVVFDKKEADQLGLSSRLDDAKDRVIISGPSHSEGDMASMLDGLSEDGSACANR